MKSAIIDELAKLPKRGLGDAVKREIQPSILEIDDLYLDRIINGSNLYLLRFNPSRFYQNKSRMLFSTPLDKGCLAAFQRAQII